MAHSTGHQLPRSLLAVLALASPLLAQEGEGTFAPIIDVSPRHGEAVASSPGEPNPLIVAAEAIPLRSDEALSAGRRSKQRRGSSVGHERQQHAVRFAQPFDPTRADQRQTTARSVSLDNERLAPVIRVYEPIRQDRRPQNSEIAAARVTDPGKLPATFRPVPTSVNHSMVLATGKERPERTNAGRDQFFHKQDAFTSRMLAAFKSPSESKTAASTIDQSKATPGAAIQPASVNKTSRSGVIQFAAENPISAHGEFQNQGQPTPQKRTSKSPSKPMSLVTEAKRSPVELRQTELAITSNPGIEVVGAAKEAPPTTQSNPPKQVLGSAAASAERTSPVVEVATNGIIRRSRTVAGSPEPTLTSKPGPVLKVVEQTMPEQLAPTAPVVTAIPSGKRTLPVVQMVDAKPLLAVLQPPPAAANLPSPLDEPQLAEEELAEELEAFELDVKPIHELSTSIRPEAGELPRNYAAARFHREGEIAHPMGFSRAKSEVWMSWEAPALCYRPLYFEDINVERHGHKIPMIQPALSAAHFFGRVPLMPYMIVSEGHFNCRYTLGHYRPGDYAPYSLYIPRLRLDASAAELAVAAGLIFAIP